MGYFAKKPTSLNDKLNDAALGFSDNIVNFVLPKNVRDGLKRATQDNLESLNNPIKRILDVPRLLRDEKPDIFYDGCNFYLTTDYGVISYRNPYCGLPGNPNKPVKPPASQHFKLPFTCGCNAIIIFGITAGNEVFSDFTGGVPDFMLFHATGTRPPDGYVDDIPSSGADSRFTIGSGVTAYIGGLPGEPHPEIFLYSKTVTAEQQGDGYVDLVMPQFEGEDCPWAVLSIACQGCPPIPHLDPPPPPDPKDKKSKDCECMCNDNLLKLVLQRIGNLPATVPINLAQATAMDASGKPIPSPTETIQSIAEMILWHVKQMDAIAGQYPIPITVTRDTSVNFSKDEHLLFPNQAEIFAEIIGLLISMKRESHANLISTVKAMTEAGMAKNVAVQTLDVALANAEFLGYKLEHQKKTIPFSFSPGKTNINDVLQESEIEIVSYINNDKVDLQDDLKTILTMTSRWNAQNWRSLDAKDLKGSLQKNLIDKPQISVNTHNAIKEETFAQFIREAQAGFTTKPGVTDSTDPWGNPESEAPIIREIGTAVDVAEANKNSAAPLTGSEKNIAKNVAEVKAIGTLLKAL